MPKVVHDRAKELQRKGLPEDVAWGRAWNERKGRVKRGRRGKRR